MVATQEWHPEDHVSFTAKQYMKAPEELYPREWMSYRRGSVAGRPPAQEMPDDLNIAFADDVNNMTWPPHCVQNSKGAEFHPDLDLDAFKIVQKGQDKTVDSYSAFWDNEHKTETELYEHLFNSAVETVVICGVGFDCAVGRTARDAATYGFDVIIAMDATCSFDERWHGEMLLELQGFGIRFCTVEEALDVRGCRPRSSSGRGPLAASCCA